VGKNLNKIVNMEPSSIVVACCGLFHYRYYVPLLHEKGLLRQFLFSHRISTFFGLGSAYNLFIKEYGLRLVQRFVSDKWHHSLFPLFHDLWDTCAVAAFCGSGKILHVMLHGNSLRLILAAREQGMVIVGEPVNTHPRNYHEVLRVESKLCGCSYSDEMPLQLERIERELKLCDFLVVPSEYVRQTFIKRGFSAQRTAVVPFGTSLSAYTPPIDVTCRTGRRLVVCCVAQVSPRKGIRCLLDLWRKLNLSSEQAELRIIGIIPDSMRHFVSGAPTGVNFLGPCDRANVVRHLQESSIFILPTLEEGFAYAILEAMATGCVPITTLPSGAASVIKHGENGFIFAPDDTGGMLDALKLLAANPELRGRMGSAAHDSVKCGFTWERYSERMIDCYVRAMTDSASAGKTTSII
jgi:hypothetical protein